MNITVSVASPLEKDAESGARFIVEMPMPSVGQYHDPNFNLMRFISPDTTVHYGIETMRWRDVPVLIAQALTEVFWVELGKEARVLAKLATTQPTE